LRLNWAEVQKAARAGVAWRDQTMYLPDGTLANW
jgi:hypothetical protein